MARLEPVEGDPFAAAGAARFVPVDHDPFASEGASTPSLVPVDHDPFADAPKKKGPGLPGAEVRAYEPTWREKIAQWMLGDEPASPEKERLVAGITGTRGLPGTEQMGAVDFTPARIPLFAQEAARSAEKGDVVGTALNALGATPVPVLNKAIEGAVGIAKARLAPKVEVAEAAERLGVDLPRSVGSRTARAVKEVPVPDMAGGNPINAGAQGALEQIAGATDDIGRKAGSDFKAQAALRDWLMAADDVSDDAAKAAQEAATAPAVSPTQTASKIPEAAPASNVGQDGAHRIITPDQSMEISAKPELVELSDLRLAEGKLQPRDRGRVEYTTEALERASRLDPEQLRPGRVSDSGAPIILEDGTILSGNGRAMSIAHVYANPELSERAAAYRASLGPDAANMKQPVLVMRAAGMTPDDAARFADLSNRGRIAAMSATERAARDAKALGSDGVSLYQGGDFDAPQNVSFMRAFMDKAVTASERAALSKDGRLTQEGIQRMRGAILASAYDDAPTLSKMLESADDNIRNITGALADAAPKFASLKADIAAGRVMSEMDATPQITEAVKKIVDLRNRGITAERHFAQLDAFDQGDPIVNAWIQAFHSDDLARPASRQRMREVLEAYADEAAKHAPDGLFPDPTTAGDVLKVARRGTDEGSEAAGSAGRGVEVASDGARNAEGGLEAVGRAADDGSGATVQGGGSAGERAAGQAGDGRQGQARDRLASWLPAAKTPQEAILDAKKARLGAALGMDGDVLPSKALARIEELVRAGTVDDVAKLLKAKSLIGAEGWETVSHGVLARMGLGRDLMRFSDEWAALSTNGKNAILGDSAMRSALDDLVTVLDVVPELRRLARSKIGDVRSQLETVPIIGGMLSGKMNIAAHAAVGIASGGHTATVSGGAWAVGKLLNRPQNVKSLTRWLKAYSALGDNSKAASTVFSLASRNLAKDLSDISGEDEAEIARKLESVRGN